MMRFRALPVLGAVVVVVAVLSGCGGGTGNGNGGGSAANTGSTSSTSSSPSSGSSGKTVAISETEYKLTPTNLTLKEPGTYTFKVVNKGSVTHALEVEGNGVETDTEDISPGKSATLTVNFKGAGSYEMYCPVDGHRDRGMEGKITIGSAAAGSGGTTQGTSTQPTTTDDMGSGGGSSGNGY
jgi:uncharacterized cupredoxin-like copper-binding protein